MNNQLPHYTILRAASLLVPRDQRAEWLQEWQSELWYVPRRKATIFCLGAFRDAFWLRRNNLRPVKRSARHLESPLSCLLFLATLAIAGISIAVSLPVPDSVAPFWRVGARDLLKGCIVMVAYTSLLLPATRITMGAAPLGHPPLPWRSRLRGAVFLVLKIALVQPIMFSGLLVVMRLVPAVSMGLCVFWILTFRWVLIDQRRRCPVCLRLLSNPVRIGAPSHTFLEWYGGESMCTRGHGLLHIPEISTSYCGGRQWLRLDGSWSTLFPQAPGARH
jgi:hypothetical protein